MNWNYTLLIVSVLSVTNLPAQNTYLLSARNPQSVEFNYDSSAKNDVGVISNIYEFFDMENQRLRRLRYGANLVLIVKHLQKRPGMYIIYGDQTYCNAYIPFVFEVDSLYNIKYDKLLPFSYFNGYDTPKIYFAIDKNNQIR